MRYRQMDANDDYVFGAAARFLVNTPATVAQAVLTRMRLWAKEWFLDAREGLAVDQILGTGTALTRDWAVQRRILGTPGVKRIVTYSSTVDQGRNFRVAATLDTVYGRVDINEVF